MDTGINISTEKAAESVKATAEAICSILETSAKNNIESHVINTALDVFSATSSINGTMISNCNLTG